MCVVYFDQHLSKNKTPHQRFGANLKKFSLMNFAANFLLYSPFLNLFVVKNVKYTTFVVKGWDG